MLLAELPGLWLINTFLWVLLHAFTPYSPPGSVPYLSQAEQLPWILISESALGQLKPRVEMLSQLASVKVVCLCQGL